ncbi:hypothetical protein V1478_008734 [Vespula squamosa]|uniref:Uncharacterized protein n=1 Tax=Vespula squamosa TaxID=30214 RepID=A0ABD2AV14_VESSQ
MNLVTTTISGIMCIDPQKYRKTKSSNINDILKPIRSQLDLFNQKKEVSNFKKITDMFHFIQAVGLVEC